MVLVVAVAVVVVAGSLLSVAVAGSLHSFSTLARHKILWPRCKIFLIN
jgi:hypothetical protein